MKRLEDAPKKKRPRKEKSKLKKVAELMAAQSVDGSDAVLRPFALRAMFMRPAYLEKSAWIEHIPFAFWLVAAHQPKVTVELGAHYGTSYFAFCQAIDRLGLDGRCYAVDTWKGDEHAGFYGSEVFEQVRNYNEANFSGFSRLIRSSFDEAAEYFIDGDIDLLHIDGLHTYESVKHDFEVWLPKLSKRAIVLLHDSNVRERQFGVFKFAKELRESYQCFEFDHGHGLTVVAIGSQQTDLLSRLFGAAQTDYESRAVHEVFGRLGRACADAYSARTEETRAKALEKAGLKHKADLDVTRDTLEKIKAELAVRGKEITELRVAVKTEAEQRVIERGQLGERAVNLQQSRDELKDEVERLNARLEIASAELKDRTASVFDLQNCMLASERQISDLVRERDSERATLAKACAELEKTSKNFDDVQLQLRAEQQEKSVLIDKVAALTTSQQSLELGLTEAKKQLEARAAELEGERRALAAAQEKIRIEAAARVAAEKATGERLVESERLNSQLQDARKEQEKLQVTVANLERLRFESEKERAAARDNLQSMRSEAEKVERSLREEIHQLNEVVARYESDSRELSAELAKERATAQERLVEAAMLVESYLSEKALLHDEKKALTAELARAESEHIEERRKLNELFVNEKAQLECARSNAFQEAASSREEMKRLSNELGHTEGVYKQLVATMEKESFEETAKLTELYLNEKAQLDLARGEAEKHVASTRAQSERVAAQLARAESQSERLKTALEKSQANINERFEEIAKLTELYLNEKTKRKDIQELSQRNEGNLIERLAELTALLNSNNARHEQQIWKFRVAAAQLIGKAISATGGYTPQRPPGRRGVRSLAHQFQAAGLIDPNWYLQRYEDVAQAGVDALDHYLNFGIFEGREPLDIGTYMDAIDNS